MGAIEITDGVDTRIGYLVPTSRVNRRFWAPGAELNTGVYDTYPVHVRDARLAPRPFTLDEHGFCMANRPSAVADFRDPDEVERVYKPEMIETARELSGADLIVPMAPQVRSAGRTGPTVQPPAAEAHVDFNTYSAGKLARRLYDVAAPDGVGYRRFICFSLWRTFSPPPQDWPLALCEAGSIDDAEGVSNTKVDVDALPTGDALFADIPGEEEMVAATIFHHSPAHRWWYYPDMTRDEAIFIKFHDSDHSRAWRAPHTAFHDTSRPGANVRESIEYRGIAYFSR